MCFHLSKPLLLQVERPLFPNVLLHGSSSSPPLPVLLLSSSPPLLVFPFPSVLCFPFLPVLVPWNLAQLDLRCSRNPSSPKVSSSSSWSLSFVFFHRPFCLFLHSSRLSFESLVLHLFISCRFCFFFSFCPILKLFNLHLLVFASLPCSCIICLQDRRSHLQFHVLSVIVQCRRYRWALVVSMLFPVTAVCCNMYCRISRSGCLSTWFLPSSLSHFRISLPLCSAVTTRPCRLKTSAIIFLSTLTDSCVLATPSGHVETPKKQQIKIFVTCSLFLARWTYYRTPHNLTRFSLLNCDLSVCVGAVDLYFY